jgi:hypothetical protein
MAESSYFWTGASIGDHGAYTADQFSDFIRSLFTTNPAVQGVLAGYANKLNVTNPAGNTIRVDTGLALVDGKVYENFVAINTDIVTPSAGNNRYDLVVLQKDWALQTVRLAILTGVEDPTPAVPTVTQSYPTIWEIALAKVYITDAGVITLTDLREYTRFAMPLVHRRQGGGADWTISGVVNYTPSLTGMQAGSAVISLIGDANGTVSVNFPAAFNQAPIVLATCDSPDYIVAVYNITASLCLISIQHRAGSLATHDFNISWLAVGEIT